MDEQILGEFMKLETKEQLKDWISITGSAILITASLLLVIIALPILGVWLLFK